MQFSSTYSAQLTARLDAALSLVYTSVMSNTMRCEMCNNPAKYIATNENCSAMMPGVCLCLAHAMSSFAYNEIELDGEDRAELQILIRITADMTDAYISERMGKAMVAAQELATANADC